MLTDSQTKEIIMKNVFMLEQMKVVYTKMDEKLAAEDKEQGIHKAVIAEIQNRDTYIDPQDRMSILKYSEDDVRASIIDTVKKCIN